MSETLAQIKHIVDTAGQNQTCLLNLRVKPLFWRRSELERYFDNVTMIFVNAMPNLKASISRRGAVYTISFSGPAAPIGVLCERILSDLKLKEFK